MPDQLPPPPRKPVKARPKKADNKAFQHPIAEKARQMRDEMREKSDVDEDEPWLSVDNEAIWTRIG
jgi:hypothetical protein